MVTAAILFVRKPQPSHTLQGEEARGETDWIVREEEMKERSVEAIVHGRRNGCHTNKQDQDPNDICDSDYLPASGPDRRCQNASATRPSNKKVPAEVNETNKHLELCNIQFSGLSAPHAWPPKAN